MQNGRGFDPLDNLPAFTLLPPPRCFHREGSSPLPICGALAMWRRLGNQWFDDAFFCDAHRSDGCVLVAGPFAMRRVRIELAVLLAGVSAAAPTAQTEAMARLTAAVESAGGLLDVTGIRSTFGKYAAWPAEGVRNASGLAPT